MNRTATMPRISPDGWLANVRLNRREPGHQLDEIMLEARPNLRNAFAVCAKPCLDTL